MSRLNFWILAFFDNFCPIKIDLSGNSNWLQASGFQNSPKLTIFGIFNELLSSHNNNNVARFARKRNETFSVISNTVYLPVDKFFHRIYPQWVLGRILAELHCNLWLYLEPQNMLHIEDNCYQQKIQCKNHHTKVSKKAKKSLFVF